MGQTENPNRRSSLYRWALSVVFVAIGLVFIVFSDQLSALVDQTPAPSGRPIATLIKKSGQVEVRPARQIEFHAIKKGQVINDKVTIRTEIGASALVGLETGYHLNLGELTSAFIETDPRNPEQVHLFVKSGTVQVQQEGPPDVLRIFRDGQLWYPKNDRDVAKTAQIHLDSPPSDPSIISQYYKPEADEPTDTTRQPSDEEESENAATSKLSNQYIGKIIRGQKPFFNRCYAQHLKKQPESTGDIHFSFSIAPSGQVANVEILKTSIEDNDLHKCVMTVISRSRFRAFDGEAIVVNYPIRFK